MLLPHWLQKVWEQLVTSSGAHPGRASSSTGRTLSTSLPCRRQASRSRQTSPERLESRQLLSASVPWTIDIATGHNYSPVAHSLQRYWAASEDSASATPGTAAAAVWQDLNSQLITGPGDTVGVHITARDVTALLPALTSLGFVTTGAHPELYFVEGMLPVDALPLLESLPAQGLLGADAIYRPILRAGLTTTQADIVHEAERVRSTLPSGYTGAGIRVGVLSDSYNSLNGASADIASGDLPATVQVLADGGAGNSDEGRAMLQLVHDIAPGASLAFATAFSGEASFAQNIRNLANPSMGNASIIVDDVGYFAEPFFQDGVIAQAVDDVVNNNNVAYFSSAGNNADASYESTVINFTSDAIGTTVTGSFYDFDTSAGVDTRQRYQLATGEGVTISLQWDQPFFTTAGVTTDLDIYLINASTGSIVASSVDFNVSNQRPVEILQFTNLGSTQNYDVMIHRFQGSNPGRIKYVNFGDYGTLQEFDTRSSTVIGHPGASRAAGVAAVPYFDQTTPEDFTSLGPVTSLFNVAGTRLTSPVVRQSPLFAAIDGGNTTFFGSDIGLDSDAFENFFGTSAAAPVAAAIAALIRQANPTFTPQQVYDRLTSTATDIGAPGVDNLTGHGLINAWDAVLGPVVPAAINFSDGFESGTLSSAWETITNGNGEIRVLSTNSPAAGTQHLVLDNIDTTSSDHLKQAILHLNTTGKTNVVLSFDQKELSDEDHPMSTSFTGSENSDGVAFSVDGTTWFRLVSLTGSNSSSSYRTHSFNLTSLAAANSVVLGNHVRIKFQQYDNGTRTSDGITIDNISVTGTDVGLNTPPTISDVADRTTSSFAAPVSLSFTVADAETAATQLVMSGTSSNTTLVPPANIVFSGTGNNRIVTITPAAGQNGTAQISLIVTDTAGGTATDTFVLTVNQYNAAPELINNLDLGVSPGQTITITPARLLTTDADNTPAQLVYHLDTLPTNGTLRLNGTPLLLNATFTQDDINQGRLTYTHNGSPNLTDTFNFTVSDSPTVNSIVRSSVTSAGVQANGTSRNPSLSADGRFVVFESNANGLAPVDTGATYQVYVRDQLLGTMTRVSVSTGGTPGDDDSTNARISANGRYVVFRSRATNLVPGDTNGSFDVFVRDLELNTTTRVSVSGVGVQGNLGSYEPSISADGQYVAFDSSASNLASNDTNGVQDIFVRDTVQSLTSLISMDPVGNPANGHSQGPTPTGPTISADGRYVVFFSLASNLVFGDTNGVQDVFIRDRQTNVTSLISVDPSGNPANGLSAQNAISADGRFVVFSSRGSNLVAGDTNASEDIFLRDLSLGTTTRISVDSSGNQANGDSTTPFSRIGISADGRYSVYASLATNLVPGDTNGRRDIFVYDRITGRTSISSVNSAAVQGNGQSAEPDISGDGRYVAFQSDASNLVSSDTNSNTDIFIVDRGVIQGTVSVIVTIPPTIAAISDQFTNEDTVLGPVNVTVGSTNTPAADLVVTATAADPNLVQSVVVGGTGANRELTITPVADLSGTSLIVVTVTDNFGLTTSMSFTLTVLPVNDAPTLTPINDVTTLEDTATFVSLSFDDIDTSVASLSVSVLSGNTALVDASGLQFTGTGNERVLNITPLPNQNGTALISVTVNDGAGGAATETFVLTVIPVADPLTLVPVSDATTLEDTPLALAVTFADDFIPAQFVTITPSASNPNVVESLSLTGTGPTRSLLISPRANVSGTAIITLIADDGLRTVTDEFLLTVVPVNDAPTITPVSQQTVLEDHVLGPIAFTLADVDSPMGSLQLTAYSSDGTLIPSSQVSITGSGSQRAVTITPLADRYGNSTITLQVSDGSGGLASTVFQVDVLSVNDAPTFTLGSNISVRADAGAVTIPNFVTNIFSGPLESGQVVAVDLFRAVNPSLFSSIPALDLATGTLTFTPNGNSFGTTTVEVRLRDNGGTSQGGIDRSLIQTFTITITVPASRSFEFNAAPTLQTNGYTSVRGTDVYDDVTGPTRTFGWNTAVTEADRSTLPNNTLLRDGHYGRDNTFTAEVPNGTYVVSLMLGDKGYARDRLNVYANGVLVPQLTNVATAAGQFLHRSFTATVTAGKLQVRLRDMGGDPFWMVHALEIRPQDQVENRLILTRSNPQGTEPLEGNGASRDSFLGTGASPNALVSVSLTGSGAAVTSVDQDPSFTGIQVRADAQGQFSIQVQRPYATRSVTIQLIAEEVTGARNGSFTQTYVDPVTRQFDMNFRNSPTSNNAIGVTNTSLYSSTRGYGWKSAVSGADRGLVSSVDAALRDLAFGSDGTFRIDVTPGAVYNVTLLFRDTYAHDRINVYVEGATTPVSAELTDLTVPANTTVQRTFPAASNDGTLDIRLRDLSTFGDRNWILNALLLTRVS